MGPRQFYTRFQSLLPLITEQITLYNQTISSYRVPHGHFFQGSDISRTRKPFPITQQSQHPVTLLFDNPNCIRSQDQLPWPFSSSSFSLPFHHINNPCHPLRRIPPLSTMGTPERPERRIRCVLILGSLRLNKHTVRWTQELSAKLAWFDKEGFYPGWVKFLR